MDASFVDKLLINELRPALGCTEPISVAFTSSLASRHIREAGDEIDEILVDLDKNVFKNGKVVKIPAPVPMRGNLHAAPLGAIIAQPDLGLQILQGLDEETCRRALSLVEEGRVKIRLDSKPTELFVQVSIRGKKGHLVIARCQGRHDRVVYLRVDDRVLTDTESEARADTSSLPTEKNSSINQNPVPARELFDFLADWSPPQPIIDRLEESMTMNLKVMEAGLSGIGTGVGVKLRELGTHECRQNLMISRCAAAVDARMAGYSLPVMSVTGSGNQGLVIFLSHRLRADLLGNSRTELYRSLIFAIHLASRIKAVSGRLSALCGCVIAAGMASAAGITRLEGGSWKEVEAAFHIMAADIMGILCDGAKASCALKVATGVNSLFRAVNLARKGFVIPPDEGIIGRTLEETMQNIGKIANPGMIQTDVEILKILENKSLNPLTDEMTRY
ncbi:MAG: L-serine ammonia-lyase, iron-sulfur-dependent, subunit alpha [Candidatus Ozemobacteraceae bacterium]